jgi:hypothetical protein
MPNAAGVEEALRHNENTYISTAEVSFMEFNKAVISVSVVTFDKNCNIKECINCSEEFIKLAVEGCRKAKQG